MARRIAFAWLPGFFGVDQTETAQPCPHRATPHLCPEAVCRAVQPFSSPYCSACSTSFFGCRTRATTTLYNVLLLFVNTRNWG